VATVVFIEHIRQSSLCADMVDGKEATSDTGSLHGSAAGHNKSAREKGNTAQKRAEHHVAG
jgi:hypothetical protein